MAECDAAVYLTSEACREAFLADILEAEDAGLLEAALELVARSRVLHPGG